MCGNCKVPPRWAALWWWFSTGEPFSVLYFRFAIIMSICHGRLHGPQCHTLQCDKQATKKQVLIEFSSIVYVSSYLQWKVPPVQPKVLYLSTILRYWVFLLTPPCFKILNTPEENVGLFPLIYLLVSKLQSMQNIHVHDKLIWCDWEFFFF